MYVLFYFIVSPPIRIPICAHCFATTTEREYYALIFIIIHFIHKNTESGGRYSLPATNSSQFCTGSSIMEMAFEVAALITDGMSHELGLL